MYLDLNFREEPWEPAPIRCQSCKHPITQGQALEQLSFDGTIHPELENINGPYHAECAKPFLSIARALKMLSFRGF